MPARLQSVGNAQLSLAGTIDFDSVPGLHKELAPHLKDGASLSIDLEGVERFNSAGLALLLQWLEEARARNVDLTFLNLPAAHGELASLYNLSGLFGED
jgi:phospholipid transport system transporter-binding protein